MTIYLIGDTHCNALGDGKKIKKIPGQENDYGIVLGDWGFIWTEKDNHEDKWFKRFRKLPYTLCFIDGNHENFERLKRFPEVDFCGEKAGLIRDCVYHLKRGRIYTIDGKKILTVGGAKSIDKNERIPGVSWWREEEITKEEEYKTYESLDANNWEVDYVLTHTLPTRIIKDHLDFPEKEDANTKFFDDLLDKGLKFKKWYCGHFHIDKTINKFNILYNTIQSI